jgi:hypothetical protein
MERRQFLQGLLASVSAGTALVKLATPDEALALTLNEPVIVNQPKAAIPGESELVGNLLFVQLRKDDFVPIGVITSLNFHRELVDYTSVRDDYPQLRPGLWRGDGTFRTYGPAILKVFDK